MLSALVAALALGARPRGACDGASARLPFCNASLPDAARADDLLGRLSISEMIDLIGHDQNEGGAVLPPYSWWNEALHGVASSPGVHFGGGAPIAAATSFAQVIGMAASFNRTLWRAVGTAVGIEARALANGGQAGRTFWAPNVNLFRDPRWGRGQETPGEDPTVAATYAFEFVSGVESRSRDGSRVRVAACCKHLTAYDVEGAEGVDRHSFDADVARRDLEESFNVPFEACVRAARVSGLMCAYNAVRGVPACASHALLTGLARERWGFDGYVTSDCGAVRDVRDAHKYTRTAAQTVRAVLRAGMDVDCGTFVAEHAAAALARGALEPALLARAARRLLLVLLRVGHFDAQAAPPSADSRLGPADVDTPAHRALALESAAQGLTLLVNDGGALPLLAGGAISRDLRGGGAISRDLGGGGAISRDLADDADDARRGPPRLAGGTISRDLAAADGVARARGAARGFELALIGELALAPVRLQGDYSGPLPFKRTLLDALRAGPHALPPGARVRYARGCGVDNASDTAAIGEAARLAARADATVLFLGLDQAQEWEGRDRTTLELPGAQPALAAAVARAAKESPVILVLACGGPVDVRAQLALPPVRAALWVGYPGQAAGDAIAAVLTGARSPAGRLPITWYPREYVERVSPLDMRLRADPRSTPPFPGRTHRFYRGPCVFEFGHGLTYARLRAPLLRVRSAAAAGGGGPTLRVSAVAAALRGAAPPPQHGGGAVGDDEGGAGAPPHRPGPTQPPHWLLAPPVAFVDVTVQRCCGACAPERVGGVRAAPGAPPGASAGQAWGDGAPTELELVVLVRLSAPPHSSRTHAAAEVAGFERVRVRECEPTTVAVPIAAYHLSALLEPGGRRARHGRAAVGRAAGGVRPGAESAAAGEASPDAAPDGSAHDANGNAEADADDDYAWPPARTAVAGVWTVRVDGASAELRVVDG